ncbi:hypothetical protein E2562_031464 [Oryza meyeriana var. granulata]|uniref:Uncharacterized protein n=1 Tax=Oryza meyeriana var. granulata TaxID=110450 RepID=A0A6G1E4W5_9ORYZ|nr:hypothetical protein E2562_031464 [Oryza meyeriana var. granulata]
MAARRGTYRGCLALDVPSCGTRGGCCSPIMVAFDNRKTSPAALEGQCDDDDTKAWSRSHGVTGESS